MRPPLKPLDMMNLHQLITDAEMIAVGTINSVTQSKTSQGRMETIVVQLFMNTDRILKGDTSLKTISIEESYEQFTANEPLDKNITVSTAGPVPPVGVYLPGDRVLVFLKSIPESDLFLPLGSGEQDSYLGLLQITSRGVASDRYMLDEAVSQYAGDEDSFISLIAGLASRFRTGQ